MKKKIISIFVCMLLFATASSVAETENIEKSDVANDAGSTIPGTLSAPGDVLFTFSPQDLTGDNGCLGVEFDGTYFWVTGRDSPGGDVHKLHKFDSDGNHVITYEQGTTSTWGWRDLAWDGTYLYGSDEDEFVKIDPADGSVVELLTKPAGLPVCRALAVNPDNGHFFSANWASPIYEFNPADGSVYATYPNTLSAYGLAYDDVTTGGPYLWVYSQDGIDPYLVQISQFDIAAGTYTGITYEGFYETSGMAGGCAFVEDWDGVPAFIGNTQGDPRDVVFVMEVGASPQIEIGDISGGLFKIKAEIKNTGAADATGVMWDIDLAGGIILLGKSTSGGPVNIPASGQIIAQSSLILGLGGTTVTVTADSATKNATATVLLFFILGL
ncbi:MAG: hypothetical protein JSW06_06625 [Thermoplasmatales archaeon]|nr:MAG: hypothetical protein JSW06_06625 [Thermoplasmatales archaeon]